MSFVNLHTHTEYSLLDGHGSVEAYCRRATELGQPALAITDHGTLGGWKHFTDSAKRHGVKPILGVEAYAAPSRTGASHKTPVLYANGGRDDISGSGKYTHLTVLATNDWGATNLYKLQTEAFQVGFYGKPRIDLEMLRAFREGLWVGTGCPGGELAVLLRLNLWDEANVYVRRLKEALDGNVFVEIMDHGGLGEALLVEKQIAIAECHGLMVIPTADSHYVNPEDSEAHDHLLCVQTRALISEEERFKFDSDGFHLPDRAELTQYEPQYLDNTLEFASRCDVPKIYDTGFTSMPRCQESFSFPRAALLDRPEYHARWTYEWSVIEGADFSSYFYVMAADIKAGRDAGIRFGYARGSAGGSLVAYILGITSIDPIEHGLIFERFLNPERLSLPDIDVDIDDARRDDFLAILRDRHGADRVANVGTYGRIGAKNSIRDANRILGGRFDTGNEILRGLPAPKFGRQPALSELKYDRKFSRVVEVAQGLEGKIRSAGVHASAIVVSPHDLPGRVPLRTPAKLPDHLITEFDGDEVAALGYVKYDYLGLATLGMIDDCYRLVGSEVEPTFDDAKTFELLSRGDTTGVFQLEGGGMRRLLKEVRPKAIADVAAVLSLYRPGPMGTGSHTEYAKRRKSGRVIYPHHEFNDSLRDVLAATYGLFVFQEQILAALAAVGGYTYATAGLLFDAMRKKDTAKMAASKPEFNDRLQDAGYSMEASEALWGILEPFADYSFNKSHAIGYAALSYVTAYLKAHHPLEFWVSLLSRETDVDKLREYINECARTGVAIRPPDINDSDFGWKITKEAITVGLGSIKGVSKRSTDKLLRTRPYTSLIDYITRADPGASNAGVLGALIKTGAFDGFGSREGMLQCLDRLTAYVSRRRELDNPTLWDAPPIIDQLPPNWIQRQKDELELLGMAISREPQPTVNLKVNRFLLEDEWTYVFKSISSNKGESLFVATLGGGSTISLGYGDVSAVYNLSKLEGVEVKIEGQE